MGTHPVFYFFSVFSHHTRMQMNRVCISGFVGRRVRREGGGMMIKLRSLVALSLVVLCVKVVAHTCVCVPCPSCSSPPEARSTLSLKFSCPFFPSLSFPSQRSNRIPGPWVSLSSTYCCWFLHIMARERRRWKQTEEGAQTERKEGAWRERTSKPSEHVMAF